MRGFRFLYEKGLWARICRARQMLNYERLQTSTRRTIMPYLLGWLLGVPLIVLVILYLIFH
ncbi:hypothetical protein CUJ90_22860 [Paraburkholderia terricola]|nr:hypothetical protein CUJ90_22860 [Paraburkholderia terricola]